jgi:flagellar hook-associated protein 3 FlgL
MAMRVTNSMIFNQNVDQISSLMSSVQTTNQEVSSGNKDLTGQNATLASQVLNIQQMQTINDQYTSSRVTARASLQQVDSTLGNAANLLASVKTLVVQAQSGTMGTSDRSAIATQIQGDLTQLQTLANTTDGAGHYIFSGYKSGTTPYTASGGVYTYNGDQGQRNVEVAQGQQMPVSVAGSTVFGNIFNQLSSLVTQLNTPIASYAGGSAQYATDLTTASGNIDQALNNVTNANVTVGDNEQQLNALDTLGSNLSVSYKQMMSSTGEVDMVQAISTLSQQQLALTAAEKSFAQVSSLSLFNYIK